MMMKMEKQTTLNFLRILNKELLLRYAELKEEFDRAPPPNNEIKKKFIDWKAKFDLIVFECLKNYQEIDEKNVNFKGLLAQMTGQFGSDQQFLELLKNVNSTVETMKDFIRVNLIKDPTIYEPTTP